MESEYLLLIYEKLNEFSSLANLITGVIQFFLVVFIIYILYKLFNLFF